MKTASQLPAERIHFGAAEITIVSDGTVVFPTDFFYKAASQEALTRLLADFYRSLETVTLQANVMVVELDGRRVLIDSGDGGKFQSTGGRLAANLHAAGIAPESIDTVVFTHLHPDHLWGVTDVDNTTLTYPNAEYVAPADDYAFWSQSGLDEKMPSDWGAWLVRTTQAHLAQIAGRLRTAEADTSVLPGLSYISTPGHTAGHASILLESDGAALVATGDVVTDPVIAFERPDWPLGVDIDEDQAAATRRELLERLASERLPTFANHLPWPGLGYVARHDRAYRWVPQSWAV